MQNGPSFPFEVSFPDFKPSESVRESVISHLEKIERLYERIISCHVSVRVPHKHRRNQIYHIKINLMLPGTNLIVNHEPEVNFDHSDVYIAIRDAFDALERRIRKRLTTINNHAMNEKKPEWPGSLDEDQL